MNHFQNYLVDEFAEDYQTGHITRRQALKLIASVTGSILVANTILAACSPADEEVTNPGSMGATAPIPSVTPLMSQNSPVDSGTVQPDDPSLISDNVEFAGEGSTLIGYKAIPNKAGSFPLILVCHENRGLNAHIEDVTRRLAKAGYAALAVDLLSRGGGSQALGSENVPGALGNTSPDQFVSDFISGWTFMKNFPEVQADRVGMVGFCFGGGVTWLMATRMPELKAAVPFYGPHPPIEDVPNIQAAVLGIYGEEDQRINQGIPVIEEAMRANGKNFEYHIYPNAGHAFHNDTGSRYNPEAARDAWSRTLQWFQKFV